MMRGRRSAGRSAALTLPARTGDRTWTMSAGANAYKSIAVIRVAGYYASVRQQSRADLHDVAS